MIQVSKEDFYKAIGPMDVHPTPVGRYPYTSEWKCQKTGRLIGKSIPNTQRTDGLGWDDSYWLDPTLVPCLLPGGLNQEQGARRTVTD